MKKFTKEEAIKAAKRMLYEKYEVKRWMLTDEPYSVLEKQGIRLGRIGK